MDESIPTNTTASAQSDPLGMLAEMMVGPDTAIPAQEPARPTGARRILRVADENPFIARRRSSRRWASCSVTSSRAMTCSAR